MWIRDRRSHFIEISNTGRRVLVVQKVFRSRRCRDLAQRSAVFQCTAISSCCCWSRENGEQSSAPESQDRRRHRATRALAESAGGMQKVHVTQRGGQLPENEVMLVARYVANGGVPEYSNHFPVLKTSASVEGAWAGHGVFYYGLNPIPKTWPRRERGTGPFVGPFPSSCKRETGHFT
jgi:hypothetical protein